MHIAFFTDTFAPQLNGVATVVANFARELSQRGHEVTVATVSIPRDERQSEPVVQEDGYRVVRYASAALPLYKEMRLAVPTVIKSLHWARFSQPDIIHAHTNFGIGWEGVALAKTLEIPLIGTHHTFLRDYAEYFKLGDLPGVDALAHKLVSSFFNRCQLVTAPSQDMINDLRESGVTVPIDLFRNPVDVNRFAVAPSLRQEGRSLLGLQGPSVIYWGRTSYEKNLLTLIKAVEPVLRADASARLVIVGDGPQRLALQTLVEAQDLAEQTIFTGRLVGQDLVRAAAAADVFASASLTENQPVSVIEAHAAGLPAVVFDARGMPEIVHDGDNGRVVPTGDVKAFTAAIHELLSDNDLRTRLSHQAQASAETYKVAAVVDDLLALYQRQLP